ncbi:MAG: VOC family protein [Corynebacteriales bacterium]|nr:VOC family protein [Mycobacteriales bacterium]
MSMSAKMVTFDCADPQRLAAWWADALGIKVGDDYGEFVLVPNEPIVLGFQKVPETKQTKNRLHLDFYTDDRLNEVARLEKLGARSIAENSVPGLTWTTMQDPDGNEFDVSGPPSQSD